MGYGKTVRSVNFGSGSLEPQPVDEDGKPKGGPANRRAEMWMKSKEWLDEPAGVSGPRSHSLQADASGPGYKYDSLSRGHPRTNATCGRAVRAARMSGMPSP